MCVLYFKVEVKLPSLRVAAHVFLGSIRSVVTFVKLEESAHASVSWTLK